MYPTKATGIHFNQRGHSVSDVRITILEKMKTSDESYRKRMIPHKQVLRFVYILLYLQILVSEHLNQYGLDQAAIHIVEVSLANTSMDTLAERLASAILNLKLYV